LNVRTFTFTPVKGNGPDGAGAVLALAGADAGAEGAAELAAGDGLVAALHAVAMRMVAIATARFRYRDTRILL
jgi:hypothetical protein